VRRIPRPWDAASDSCVSTSTLQVGDVVFFPELLSGAGEFEGLSFVVPAAIASVARTDCALALVWSDVEGLVFPQPVITLLRSGPAQCAPATEPAAHAQDDSKLHFDPAVLERQYAPAAAKVLQLQGGLSLADILGSASAVDDFWAAPDIQSPPRHGSRTPPHVTVSNEHVAFVLDIQSCHVEKTWTFAAG